MNTTGILKIYETKYKYTKADINILVTCKPTDRLQLKYVDKKIKKTF